MKILLIASDKGGHFVPFIEEQITALEACGISVVRYGITGKGIMSYLRSLPGLKRMIIAERPDLIHAHYGLSGLLANLQRRVPVVTTYHGSDINLPKILRYSKIAIHLSAHNIFVSKRNVLLAFRLSPFAFRLKKRSTLLPCGVNLTDDQLTSRAEARKALGIADDAKVVLFAGAFANAVKDAPLAQEVIRVVNNNISTENGEATTHTSRLSPFASNLILQQLRGFSRAEVNCWMCAANCLLMTSKTEGSPQVVKEAMACGCPIVSVDVGDVAERVSGVEGCYVVSSREPADIAQALEKAIAFEGKTNGRARILEMGLSNEQVAERLIAIYKSLV